VKALKHDFCNVALKGAGCEDLPAVRDAAQNQWFTYWEPSEEDRRRIAQGGHVRLCLRGDRHPPVSIDTEDWE